MKTINLKQLAEMLSLNISTVSRALNGHPDIKPETRARVKYAADQFNYVPNLHARYFRKKSSSMIAVILPEYNMFFYPELMMGINSVLQQHGYSLIVFFSNNSREEEVNIIRHCLSWVVDAVIISLGDETNDLSHLASLKDANISVLLVDKVLYTNEFSTITIDEENAVRSSVNLLVKRGRSRILGLFAKQQLEISKRRAMGFLAGIEENQIPLENCCVKFMDDPNQIAQFSTDFLKSYDAVFVMTDALLLPMYSLLKKENLYPASVSLVAISDGYLPRQLYPNVSHIHHSGKSVGVTAAETILRMIQDEQSLNHIKVPVSLVVFDEINS